MTPQPPGSRWEANAGNGFHTSKQRNRTKPAARKGTVRGTRSTDRIMPATSSITMTPGSLAPRARSARPPAQMPTAVTTAKVTARPRGVEGINHSASAVTRLPAVPGATGHRPTPRTEASATATRSARLLADELVAVHLGDAHVGEAAGLKRAVAEQHDAVDLGGLAGEPALERKRGVGPRPIDEHGLARAEQRLLAGPRQPVLRLLHEPGPLGHHLVGHGVRHVGGRRALLARVGEDAEAVERHLLHEVE